MTEARIDKQPVPVVAIFDSGERWADRYRIVFQCRDGSFYAVVGGETGNVPNGVWMTSERTGTRPESYGTAGERDAVRERAVTWARLPEAVRRAVLGEIRLGVNEGWFDANHVPFPAGSNGEGDR